MAKRSRRKQADNPAAPRTEVIQTALLRIALIVAAGLWVYAPAFQGDWLWDDDWYITNNPLLRTSAGLWSFWLHPGVWIEYYPIQETLLWIEWHLFGMETLGYHLVSVALHIIDALLVWRLLDKLGLPKAWLGGLIFAVHPVCVDSVAWIVESKNTLSMLPFLLTLCAWIDFDERKAPLDYTRALLLFIAAMLCKITVSPFPVLILLYAWWKRRSLTVADLRNSAPFFAVSVVFGIITVACSTWYYQNTGEVPEPKPAITWLARIALAGQSLGVWFAHCFWPVNLLPVYPQWTVNPTSPMAFTPWVVLAAILFYLWQKRATWTRHALLGLGFFLVFLGPFAGFITWGYMKFTWVMDHFLYIPIIGLIGLTVAAIGQVEARLPANARIFVTVAVTTLIALLAFESRGYSVAYSDEETLWGYAVEHNPNNWMAQDNLGKALILHNRPEEAVPHLETALQLLPHRAQAHFNLGRAFVAMDRLPEGLAQYDRALALSPGDADIYNQKGVALIQANRLPEALAQFQLALALRPDYAQALDNQGIALAQSHRFPEAIAAFTAALKITPNNTSTLDNLASAQREAGQTAEATATFQRVLQLDPTDAKAQQALAPGK